eukprot:58671-Pleurochrysis_carterae.AAC.5
MLMCVGDRRSRCAKRAPPPSQETLRQADSCHVKITNYKKDGQRFLNLLSLKSIHDSHHVYRFCVGMLLDVTEDAKSIGKAEDSRCVRAVPRAGVERFVGEANAPSSLCAAVNVPRVLRPLDVLLTMLVTIEGVSLTCKSHPSNTALPSSSRRRSVHRCRRGRFATNTPAHTHSLSRSLEVANVWTARNHTRRTWAPHSALEESTPALSDVFASFDCRLVALRDSFMLLPSVLPLSSAAPAEALQARRKAQASESMLTVQAKVAAAMKTPLPRKIAVGETLTYRDNRKELLCKMQDSSKRK